MTRWKTIAAVDSDKAACKVYAANFPGVEVQCCRVEDAMLPSADIILAGFPCQPHSFAGKRKAGGDERDGGEAFLAAIEKVRPRMFLGENVDGILSSEGGKYVARLVARMESLGYVVQVKSLDAVDFGVPQFRNRVWFWGIRNDVEAVHRWPTRTHMDQAKRGALFGEDLPPWVSCGEALGIEWWATETNTTGGMSCVPRPGIVPSSSPVASGNALGGLLACVRVFGAGTNPGGNNDDRTTRDITDEPSPTIPVDAGNAISEYRYSDAMYAKHAPAAPAPTVQAKWYKGGAEGLVMAPSADGRPWDSRHPVASPPAPAIRARSPRDGGRCTENVVVVPGPHLPTTTIFGEPVKWIRKGDDWMRRLSPMECARLQSVPDDFVWPDSVSKSSRYRIIGNGVACGIAVHLSRALAEADPKSRTVLDLFCGGGLWACGWHGRSWTHTEAQ